MVGCKETLRREFKWKNLGFSGVREERFCNPQWRWPVWAYLLYRSLFMLYVLFWLAYSSGSFHNREPTSTYKWYAFLTNWTYAFLAVYATWHLIAAIIYHTLTSVNARRGTGESSCCMRPSEEFHKSLFTELDEEALYERVSGTERGGGGGGSSDRLAASRPPWYLCLLWILYSAVSSGALMVTVVYFLVLFPFSGEFPHVDVVNFQVHAVNSFLVLAEHFISAIPYRLLHVVYPMLYGLLYMLFNLYYWTTDHSNVVYPIIDWNKPGIVVGYIAGIGAVLLPLFHAFFFLQYKIRMALFRGSL